MHLSTQSKTAIRKLLFYATMQKCCKLSFLAYPYLTSNLFAEQRISRLKYRKNDREECKVHVLSEKTRDDIIFKMLVGYMHQNHEKLHFI